MTIRYSEAKTLRDILSALAGTLIISDGGGSISVDDNGGSLTIDTPQLPAALVGGKLDIRALSGIGDSVSITGLVKAREDNQAMTWVSNVTGAPGAGAVLADTGALAAGDYDFDIELNAMEALAAGKGMIVEHRNAANAATLFSLGGCPAGNSIQLQIRRYTLALNERIRIIGGPVAGAVGSQYISAIGRRIS